MPSFGCLSHQGCAKCGRMCCKLWDYCFGVIPSLMCSSELVHCIKCGGNGYFIWIFLFFFVYTSLSPSLVSCLLAQVACSIIPEECLLFRLLEGSASSSFLLGLSSMCWTRVNVWVAFLPSQIGPMGSIPYSCLTPPTTSFNTKVSFLYQKVLTLIY